MSEEILKALMQLFAIISKQDDGVSLTERAFVERFLFQQLSSDDVKDYMALFDEYAEEKLAGKEDGKKKLTSVKDSVRTLSICKKINKTLTQKQKVIVLIRLFELIKTDDQLTDQKMQIIDTVSTVFNIAPEEYKSLETFVFGKDLRTGGEVSDLLLVCSDGDNLGEGRMHLANKDFDGIIGILFVHSVNMYFLRYEGHNEILLNGLPVNVSQVYLFAPGSTIRLPIGDPIYYSDISAKFMSEGENTKISFAAQNLEFKFPNGAVGLRDINIQEGPGRLIAIMGGSGAGKTTLLNVLAGLEKPSSGAVKINGFDVHHQSEKLEGTVGYVAQDDILFEDLTVFENLYYNAKLCLNHLNEEQLVESVNHTLKNLGLYEIRDIKVGNVLNKKISGGQRKRLNIALELIREPSVMFLDEPTSGLSSRDSENVVDLLKELSLKGKLIFVVIHQPSSDIYKMFDKVIILDVGGYPIYNGNPVQAVIYFKTITNQINSDVGQCPSCGNVNPEQIFNTIEAKVVDEYGNLTDRRKISPKIWNDHYVQNIKTDKVEEINETPPKTLHIPTVVEQMKVFLTREVLSKLANSQYLLINFLEAPLLALVLAFIIRHVDDHETGRYSFAFNENIPAYIFMSIIVALFMGLTVSAEEIIKDAKVLKRETFLNLSRSAYLLSKVVLLFTLSAIQTFSFVLIGNVLLGIEGMTFAYWLVLFSVSCMANMLGLNVSASFNSAVTIYILIPILLIPQMILSGAIFSFDKLNKVVGSVERVPLIADVMASRWAYEALAVTQFKDNKFQKFFFELEQKESCADFKQVYWAPYINQKIEDIKDALEKGDATSQASIPADLLVLKNEFSAEALKFASVAGMLSMDDFVSPDAKKLDRMKAALEQVKKEYAQIFAEANNEKDRRITAMLSDSATKAIFQQTKINYHNESLSDLVRRIDVKNRIVEYNGKLIQVLDPVYRYPEANKGLLNYRAHFYAPKKPLFGQLHDTFYFNVIVIWIMTGILYLMLYFGIFKGLIDGISKISLSLPTIKSIKKPISKQETKPTQQPIA